MYKCKICGKKYTELAALYNHIETKHKEMIPKDMNVQQYYYYMKTGRMNGNCVMCKKPTTWNNNTGKYNRFCGDPKCKDEYVKIMKSRMIAKYGKTHLLNDPEKQREMLANRSISGVYKWSDGKHETTYTGSYELDFLKTLDGFFDWDPEDISMPSPHTYTYKYEGEDKFYIPDVFIHSLDLEIEIKDGGDNPNNHYKIQAVDKHKEALKDEVMCSQKAFHYIKITNKNYENFFEFLKEAKKAFEKYGDETKIPRIFKIEDIKGNYTIKESTEVIEEGVKDIISYFTGFGTRSHRDLDKVLSLNFDMVKNNPEELQAFLKRLAKSANTVDDIEYIRHMNKRSKDHCKMMMKKMPEMKDQYEKYYNWILDGGIEKDIKKRKKEVKIKESYDIGTNVKPVKESLEIVEEGLISKLKDKIIKPKDPFNMSHRELKAKVDDAKKAYQKATTDGTFNMNEPRDVYRYSVILLNERNRVKNVIDVMENDKNCDSEKLWLMKHYRDWLQEFENQIINNMVNYIKKDIVESKSKISKSFNNCKEPSQYREFITAVTYIIRYYRNLASLVNMPEVDAHCKWLESMHKKAWDKADIGDGPLVFESNTEMWDDYDILEEKFEPDKFLVWFDKPIQKLKGGKIKLYHGTLERRKGNTFVPFSVNVGATKYSDPRWSIYFWDNREDAMIWSSARAVMDIVGVENMLYIGHNEDSKVIVKRPKGMTDKEFANYLIEKSGEFYIYEVEVDIKDLEVGARPIIREYTVSKPVDILKEYKYKLNKEIIRRCVRMVDEVQFKDYDEKYGILNNTDSKRGPVLNTILDPHRNSYRLILVSELRNGNVRPGDDLSDFRYSINRHLKANTYNYESYIIDRMEESSISIPQMSMYLQNEYEEEMRNYLNTYKKYYNLMLEEQPAAVKHINEDIRKCLIVIDGLADKGVENNLVQFAKDDLGEIVKASKHGKPVKVYEASGFKIPTKGELWISTDWHFYKNKDNTKFKTNPNIDKILSNYKKCVKPNDTFIFLGDLYDARTIFDMKLVPKIFDIKGLKGHKIMIKGNHDVNTTQFYLDLGFDEVYEKTYNIGNIVFSHEPIEVNSDEINIHGHIHFSETYWGMESTNHLDAYVEHYDFKPVKINDIINEYRDSNRLTKKALYKFDGSIIHESMINDLVNIDDNINDIIECKIMYNTNSKQLFSLMDINSKLIIENSFVVQREKVGTKCSVSPCYKDIEGEKTLEFSLIFDEKVNIKDLNSKLTEGITITNLHKFNDESYKFIKEACIRLFGVYPKEIKIK